MALVSMLQPIPVAQTATPEAPDRSDKPENEQSVLEEVAYRLFPSLVSGRGLRQITEGPPLDLSTASMMERISSGSVRELQVRLPRVEIFRELWNLPLYGPLRHRRVEIPEGTRLSAREIRLGAGGRVESGLISIHYPNDADIKNNKHFYSIGGTPRYIRFDQGRIYLKVEWDYFSGFFNKQIARSNDGVVHTDDGELDVTDYLATRVQRYFNKESAGGEAESETESPTVPIFPELMEWFFGKTISQDINDWHITTNVHVLNILTGVRFEAEFFLKTPLIVDDEQGLAVFAPHATLTMNGLEEISLKVDDPLVHQTEEDQRMVILAGKALHIGVTNITLTEDGTIAAQASLDPQGFAARIPGRWQAEPIQIDLGDSSEPELNCDLTLSRDAGLRVTYQINPLALASEAHPEVDGSIDLKGHGSFAVSPEGTFSLLGKITHALMLRSFFLKRNKKVSLEQHCNWDLETLDFGNQPLIADYRCRMEDASWESQDLFVGMSQTQSRPPRFENYFLRTAAANFMLEASWDDSPDALDNHGRITWLPREGALEASFNAGNLQGLRLHVDTQNGIAISLDIYRTEIQTFLSSPHITNIMDSALRINHMHAHFEDEQTLVITGQVPGDFFLETMASGTLKISAFDHEFPIEHGHLKITEIRYDTKKRQATFIGHIHLESHLTPNDYFGKLPLRFFDPRKRDQELKLNFLLSRATFSPDGFIIPQGRVDVTVEHPATMPTESSDFILPEAHYPLDMPDLEAARPKAGAKPLLPPFFEEKLPLLWSQSNADVIGVLQNLDMRLDDWGQWPRAALALFAQTEINLALPYGQAEIPVYGTANNGISLRFDQNNSGLTFRAVPSETSTALSPRLEKVFLTLGLLPNAENPQKWSQTDAPRVCVNLAGVCITQKDFRLKGATLVVDDDPYCNDTPLTGACLQGLRRRAGQLLLHFDALSEKSVAELLLTALDIDDDDLKQAGLVINGNHLRIPINFDEIRALAGQKLSSTSDEKSAPVQIEIMPGRQTLHVSHRPGDDHILVRPIQINSAGVVLDAAKDHRVGIVNFGLSTARYRESRPGHLEMSGTLYGQRAQWALSLVSGNLQDFQARNPAIHHWHDVSALYGSIAHVSSATSTITSDNHELKIESAPRFSQLQVGYREPFLVAGAASFRTDTFDLRHPRLSVIDVHNVSIRGLEALFPIEEDAARALTQESIILQAASMEAGDGKGKLIIKGETFPIGGHSKLEDVLIRYSKDRNSLEAGRIDITLKEIPISFLALPKELNTRKLELVNVRLKGTLRESSIADGIIQIQGDIELSAEGTVDVDYQGQTIKSPIKVRIGSVHQMRFEQSIFREKKTFRLTDLQFSDAHVSLPLIDGQLQKIGGLFSMKIRSNHRPSSLEVKVASGTLKIVRDAQWTYPQIHLDGTRLDAKISTPKAELHLNSDVLRRIHYPGARSTVLFEGNIRYDALQPASTIDFIAYRGRWTTYFQAARLQGPSAP